MTDFGTARTRAFEAGRSSPTTIETVALAASVGRSLAVDVRANGQLPGFDSAAMDGWAVQGDGPWVLGDPIRAGDAIPEPLSAGTARPISTGAPVPNSTTRVLRSEFGHITASSLISSGDDERTHVRPGGEEAAVGDLLIAAGERLTPPRLALAAVAGFDDLEVVAAPDSQLLVLGDEIVEAGRPTPGLVRDAFSPALPAVLAALGLQAPRLGRVGDSLDATIDAICTSTAHLLVTTGGSARGTADHLRASLAALGAEMVLDGIAMRPGHPLMLARLPAGRLVLCLPGNPLAAYIGLVAIGGALVDGMLRRPLPALRHATMAVLVEGGARTTRLVAARHTERGLEPTEHQGAGMLRGIADAHLIAVIPPAGAHAGDQVETIPLPW